MSSSNEVRRQGKELFCSQRRPVEEGMFHIARRFPDDELTAMPPPAPSRQPDRGDARVGARSRRSLWRAALCSEMGPEDRHACDQERGAFSVRLSASVGLEAEVDDLRDAEPIAGVDAAAKAKTEIDKLHHSEANRGADEGAALAKRRVLDAGREVTKKERGRRDPAALGRGRALGAIGLLPEGDREGYEGVRPAD